MRIYPDSSFLVSWLCSADKLNPRAKAWFYAHQNDDWVVSDWYQIALANARGFRAVSFI
ncbi:MAG TPA: hypothetical protein VIL39_11205 [Verrucomicrobiae bacterium]|jgi:hypothetical protein